MRALVIAAALVLTGCTSAAGLVKELAKDKASACVFVTTIYGASQAVRVGEGQIVMFGEKCQAASRPLSGGVPQ